MTFEEDLEEELLLGYYFVDTYVAGPATEGILPGLASGSAPEYGGPIASQQIGMRTYYRNMMCGINYEIAAGLAVNPETSFDTLPVDYSGSGTSELPMPCVFLEKTARGVEATPLLTKIKIKIKAGTYSAQEISQIITDQLTGVTNPENNQPANQFFQQADSYDGGSIETNRGYTGNPSSSTTVALCPLMSPPFNTTITPYEDSGILAYATKTATDRTNITNLTNTYIELVRPSFDGSPISVGDIYDPTYTRNSVTGQIRRIPGNQLAVAMFGVTPNHMRYLLDAWKNSENDLDLDYVVEDGSTGAGVGLFNNFCNAKEPEQTTGHKRRFVICPQSPDSQKLVSGTPKSFSDTYRPIYMAVGAPEIQLSYDNEKSQFKLSNFHTSRRQGSHDLFGNESLNPQQETSYVRRATRESVFNGEAAYPLPSGAQLKNTPVVGQPNRYTAPSLPGQFASITSSQRFQIAEATQKSMTRLGGVYIRNWAVLSAQKLGTSRKGKLTQPDAEGNLYERNKRNFNDFSDFFNSEDEAKEAWKNTLWGRLGFSYDQLQGNDSRERRKCFINADYNQVNGDFVLQEMPGFTTDSNIDNSALPTISTIYNSIGYTETSGNTSKVIVAPGALAGFNLADTNLPFNACYSGGSDIKAFIQSYYYRATMIPVNTTSDVVVAKNLPQLTEKGYLVITTESFTDKDQVGENKDTSMLLDMVPISSLNSTDFIQNRNLLTHTLTNPITLNEININVLKPDLTDIALQPSSTVLLQITLPMPPQTLLPPQELQKLVELENKENKAQTAK
jgi:hypothetical protein